MYVIIKVLIRGSASHPLCQCDCTFWDKTLTITGLAYIQSTTEYDAVVSCYSQRICNNNCISQRICNT